MARVDILQGRFKCNDKHGPRMHIESYKYDGTTKVVTLRLRGVTHDLTPLDWLILADGLWADEDALPTGQCSPVEYVSVDSLPWARRTCTIRLLTADESHVNIGD